MGVPEEHHQMEGSTAVDVVAAGIALRSPLKPILTKSTMEKREAGGGDDEYCSSTTPTSAGSRIPSRMQCPPAPKKRKSAPLRCHFGGSVKEFFNPPDLDTIFTRRELI